MVKLQLVDNLLFDNLKILDKTNNTFR